MTVFDEIAAERDRAHAKHGNTSMESYPPDDLHRLAILDEEIGEVAREFNEARHEGRPVDLGKLHKELIQAGAMCAAWADACIHPPYDSPESGLPMRSAKHHDVLVVVLIIFIILAALAAVVLAHGG